MQMPIVWAESWWASDCLPSHRDRPLERSARTALVNKAAAPGGGYYVAAGDDTHQWAKNLRVSGRCLLRVKRRAAEYVATELLGDEYAAAVKALAPPIGGSRNAITGPAFRLDELE